MRVRAGRRAVTAMFVVVVVPKTVSAQASDEGVQAASFLVGCWAQPSDNASGLREMYAPPAANMITGLSQFWRNGRIVDFEFHRIDGTPDGPVLTPHPRGVASVSFRPSAVGENRIVWQNLEHDFPQRIIYHRVAADTLVVRIEGGTGAEARSREWRMARVDCMRGSVGG